MRVAPARDVQRLLSRGGGDADEAAVAATGATPVNQHTAMRHREIWLQATGRIFNASMIETARHRELQMKEWKRAWKLRVIEEMNPEWEDLFENSGWPPWTAQLGPGLRRGTGED